MNKLRKLFRGSGRAFAFIFAASIIWLLFDMAALRFSFSEINTKVLKEEMIQQERQRFRGWRNPEKRSLGRWSREESKGAPPPPPPPPGRLGRDGRDDRDHPEDAGAGRPEEGLEEEVGKGQKPPTGAKGNTEVAEAAEAAKMMVLRRTIPVKLWWSPPQPFSVPMEKKDREGGLSSTKPLQTKPVLPKGGQRTHAAPTTGQPLVKVTQSVASVKTQATPKLHRPSTERSRERKGASFQVGLEGKDSLAASKWELPIGSKRDESLESPQVLRVIKVPVNRTEGIVRTEGIHGEMGNLDLLASKVAVSKAAKKTTLEAVGAGKLSKEGDIKMAHAKEYLGNNQVVIISKEEARVVFPATQNLLADAEVNGWMEKTIQPPDSKSKHNKLEVVNMTKTGHPLTKAILAKGTKPGNIGMASLVDKDQLKKNIPSDDAVHFAENTRLHKVLTIDRTLTPRDPKAPGQFGRPAVVPGEKQEEAKRRWNEGNFNVYLSDLIPVDRAIDDTRPKGCSDLLVHNELPTTSVIMCFVDEVWSTLLRSVHSVLNRSPPQFIKEIILVDDFSTKAYLKDKLDKYMAQFPKVHILHLKERHGLIRARLAGAAIARGDVLTFLDSHVECNVGWLEPLLERIHLNRKKVACPVIEVISDKDMSYMTVDSFQRGIFTWPMNFGWKPIPPDVIVKNKIKETDTIKCPVMAGGLFSIDKKYFFELGTYDPGLDVWGGENMELSFKVWMCGGEIEIIPCSRVGHIFRNDNPYSFPKDRLATVERNLARVAEVWLDEYKDLFYGHAYHLIQKNLDVGNLTRQKELRKQLHCKSFRWYLENIYPDLEAPLVKAGGMIMNRALAKCITVNQSSLAFEPCDIKNKNQKFNYTWLRLIQHGDSCVAPIDAKGTLGLHPCDKRNNGLKWLHKSLVAFHPELMDHIVLEHLPRATCLEVDQSQKALRANICSSSSLYQKWQFGNYYAD
uniref:Polypeptide N-acetylgalactosaminyltransferase n=1 Tax=Pogona vitticeps TaxID=103695 RepID=A0A6J0U9Y1_9SAUR